MPEKEKGKGGHKGTAGSTGSQPDGTRAIKTQGRGSFPERARNRHGNQEEAVGFGTVSGATGWGPISLYCARYVDGTEINVCSDGRGPMGRRLERETGSKSKEVALPRRGECGHQDECGLHTKPFPALRITKGRCLASAWKFPDAPLINAINNMPTSPQLQTAQP